MACIALLVATFFTISVIRAVFTTKFEASVTRQGVKKWVAGMADPYKKLDAELQPPEEEKEPFVKQTRSSDDMIEELTRKRTWKYTLMIVAMSLVWIGGPSSVYITSFAGNKNSVFILSDISSLVHFWTTLMIYYFL